MATIIQAVFEGGVLRPTKPLALTEGETVEVIIAEMNSFRPQIREATSEEEDYARRIRRAKSLQEMFAVMATAPLTDGDEFDIVKEINKSRQLTGFRMPDPEPA